MGTACPAVHLRPGGNERPPRTLAFFHAQDPHHAHRCSFPRARPASFRNSSWRNSMVAAPAAGPPRRFPPPAGPGGRVRVPGVRPGPAGPAAPLGGKEAASAGFLGAVTGLSVGGGVGRDEAPPTFYTPPLVILVPPTFPCHSSRFLPRPRPCLWLLNSSGLHRSQISPFPELLLPHPFPTSSFYPRLSLLQGSFLRFAPATCFP